MRTILIVIIIAFYGCAEKDPPPTLDELLQGIWVREWDVNTNMNFHAGACDVCANLPVHPPYCWNYAYTTDDNTLTMIDLVSLKKAMYMVEFPTDSTAVLKEIGGGDYYLTRIQ